MSTWLTFFQSYLNPGKLAAVSVPGMVIAFALVLVLGPVPCQKPSACPYCSTSLTPVKDPIDKTKNSSPANLQTFIQGASKPLSEELGLAAGLDLTKQIRAFNMARLPSGAPLKDRSPLTPIVDPAPAAPATTAPATTAAAAAAPIDSCLILPRYIMATSTTTIDVGDPKAKTPTKALITAEQAAQKASLKLYVVDLDPANGWDPTSQKPPIGKIQSSDVSACNTLLSQIKEGAALNSKALAQFLTQANADLGTLSTNLVSAQNLGQTLVAGSLQGAIRNKRDYIAWAQQEQAQVSNVLTAEQALEGRVTPLVTATTTAPTPAPAKSPSAVQDVMQTIQDNLVKFLILSLIIGQILDPLQRGAVSFFGPRRDFFIAFNEVYGPKGDGEIRYGDRRLWPWTLRNGKPNEEASIAAARAFAKDPNIYDKNYAIGAGYITQSDSQLIENDWYTQSQLTSGLVLPMVILSLSLGIRAVCCSATASGNFGWPTVIILTGMPLGIILGGYITSLLLHLSSARYGLVAGALWRWFSTPTTEAYVRGQETKPGKESKAKHGKALEAEKAEEERLSSRAMKITIIIWLAIIVGIVAVLATIQVPDTWRWTNPLGSAANGLTLSALALILSPLLFVIPLWVAGLDRLHKYYSELQARIGGNLLRLEATTEQKFIDLLSDQTASCALKAKFDETIDARKRLDSVFKGLDCTAVQAAGDPPEGDADPSTDAPAATPDATQADNSSNAQG